MIAVTWICMIGISVVSTILQGRWGALTPAAMEGAQGAITIGISMAGTLCLWCGVVKIMEKSALTERIGTVLQPVLGWLFPEIRRDPVAMGYLTGNVSANLLGLGNAATPMGIAAVKRMQTLRGGTEAGDEMCRLIVMNTASIQLLPTTVATVRAACGTEAPFDILPAVWITSLCSVTVGLLAARFLRKFYA